MKTFVKALFFVFVAVLAWNWLFEPNIIIVDSDASGWVVFPIVAFATLAAIMAVFGTLVAVLCAFGIAILTLFAVGLSMLWPLLLVFAIGYWLFKPDKSANI
jgi:hypothetical protein